ncbi:MAG: NAD(P)-dependent alcohol dehydrogenase [Rubrobacteraceae bacterium]
MKRWMMKADVTDAAMLVMEEVPMPEPGPGEVRVRVRAVSVNYRDQLVLGPGDFGRLPGQDLTPLSDVAGEVDALGEGVDAWEVGDRVTNLHFKGWEDGPPPAEGTGLGLGALDEDGVLAEYVVLAGTRLTRAPSNLDFAEAATLPVAGVTAWHAVAADHPVTAGQKAMIIGSGGVSLFSLQLAQAFGAEVSAVVRQDAKGERLKEMGVATVVNSTTTPEWGQEVFESTGGVQKAVDTVGVGTLNQSIGALGSGGEVALVGLFEMVGDPVDAMSLMFKNGILRGVAVGSARMHRDLVAAIEYYDIHPVIDRRVSLDDSPEAFRAQVSREIFGKVVIEVS